MNHTKLNKKHLAVVVVGLVVITAVIIYSSIPRFPINKFEIDSNTYNECIERRDSEFSGSVVRGEILITFKELTMNDEAKNLLSLYDFDTSRMQYSNDYWVVVHFTGDEAGFIQYLEGIDGIHKALRGHTAVFTVTFGEEFPKREVEDILRSYDGVNISSISFNIGYAYGEIRVQPGEEVNYACELEQYDIVLSTHPSVIISAF